jgi:hypothetical protein
LASFSPSLPVLLSQSPPSASASFAARAQRLEG